MSQPRVGLIVVMLALASLVTTALLVMLILARTDRSHTVAESNPLFEQGLPLPPFTLTERSGAPMGTEQLSGRIWIADFIFTRCMGVCPRLTREMSHLHAALADHAARDDIRFVSITVDPEHDTPERLAAYADRFDADPQRWLFLTGERKTIWTLSRDGFKLPVADNPDDRMMPIIHTQNFILVDRRGRIRGYYDAMDPERLSRLRNDLDLLLREPAPADEAPGD
ncbi:MAG: photosynthetic protein synthase I [Phycisphaeraceae bacterium]|nr:photosynthetic protein synthase I [Phycisphaeraceae bacterium]